MPENSDLIQLWYIGKDCWDRPVYKDIDGRLWKDIDPLSYKNPKLCTAYQNSYDGEPDTPMQCTDRFRGKAIEFIPHRVVWR